MSGGLLVLPCTEITPANVAHKRGSLIIANGARSPPLTRVLNVTETTILFYRVLVICDFWASGQRLIRT